MATIRKDFGSEKKGFFTSILLLEAGNIHPFIDTPLPKGITFQLLKEVRSLKYI